MFESHFPQAIKSITKNNSGVEFTGIFQETNHAREADYRLSAWSEGLYVKQIAGIGSRTENSILISLQIWKIESELVEYLQLPEKIINKIKTFGNYWFPVAQFCAQDPRAKDLLEHNPILLALIINKFFNKGQNLIDLKNILDKKQTEVLKLMGVVPLNRRNSLPKIVHL